MILKLDVCPNFGFTWLKIKHRSGKFYINLLRTSKQFDKLSIVITPKHKVVSYDILKKNTSRESALPTVSLYVCLDFFLTFL